MSGIDITARRVSDDSAHEWPTFEQSVVWQDAVRVRRWDEALKDPDAIVPTLRHDLGRFARGEWDERSIVLGSISTTGCVRRFTLAVRELTTPEES